MRRSFLPVFRWCSSYYAGTPTSPGKAGHTRRDIDGTYISIPAAVTAFPGGLYRAPRSWAERSYHKLIYFHEVDKG
jgi:hypothetical protein